MNKKRTLSIRPLWLALLVTVGAGFIRPVGAWTWDDDETVSKDELDIQTETYRKKAEAGLPLQERIAMLDRLIKLFEVHKRDSKKLEEERTQLMADENAIQTVSVLSRQKSQELFQKAFDLVNQGKYQEAQAYIQESEHLNPSDKIVTELNEKLALVVTIMPQAPVKPETGDLVKKGVAQFLQGEPSKALNFLLYAQQRDASDTRLASLVEVVRRAYPNESSDILDTHLNLVDQKLQKALEKIYAGEYLVAAKECQEVLDLEPDNALAMTRLGSVYYAMGQVKQARTYWQQALTLDKNNEVIKSFLEQTQTEEDRAPAQALTYKVQEGDTLSSIAQKIYNDTGAWKKLFEANRAYLKDAYTLNPGQVLVLPPRGAALGAK